MDLRDVLRRFAAGRPRVLVVAVPGGAAARLAVEAEVARRRWAVASGPADADLLVVAGTPGPTLRQLADGLWRQLSGPRARTDVVHAADAGDALEAAARRLASDDHADVPARDRDDSVLVDAGRPGGGTAGMAHEMHGDHDVGDGRHAGHDMGGMEMPGGLAMADRADDRDGLTLDRLHVPLGPVLPDWPAGLVVRVALQGDIVQHAEVEVLDGGDGSAFWDEPWLDATSGTKVSRGTAARRSAGRDLDGLARLLGVAGWTGVAAQARSLRDDVLAGVSADPIGPAATSFARRVERSRTLRWLAAGIDTGHGDVHELMGRRLADMLDAIGGVDDAAPLDGDAPRPQRPDPRELPSVLTGLELAAVRLVVAVLDPDIDAAVATGTERAHG